MKPKNYPDKNFLFVRFGLLNHRNEQKMWVGNVKGSEHFYHKAPANRGFYAMPYLFQDFFLISVSDKLQEGKLPFKKVKESCSFKSIDCPFSDKNCSDKSLDCPFDHWFFNGENCSFMEKYHAAKKFNKRVVMNNRRFFYKKHGHIWHHLKDYVPNHLVLKRSGSWILTDMKTWYDGIRKYKVKSKCSYHNETNTWATSHHWLDREYLEVFIDEKVD